MNLTQFYWSVYLLIHLCFLLVSGLTGPPGDLGFVGPKGEKGDKGFSLQGLPGFPGIKGQFRNSGGEESQLRLHMD